ncbi:MAG: hypothetical protein NTY35_01930 [Planctomycetota bacterium]|nr:hypothetical protein [Planctomycetota bacterium]
MSASRPALVLLLLVPSASAQVRELWAQSHDGAAAGQQDLAYAVATDGARVAVTGKSYNTTSGFPPPPPTGDIETVRYDLAGTELWSRRFNGPLNGDDVGYEVAIGAGGIVYVAGQSAGYSGSSYESQRTLLAYDASGNLSWSRTVGTTGGPNFLRGMALASNGDVIVCGSDGANGGDLSVERVDAGGNLVWSWSADGGNGGYDLLYDVEIGPGGDVWAAGYVETATRGKDAVLVRLAGGTGAQQWLVTRDGGANLDDYAFRVAVDAAGASCVGGYATSLANGQDALVVRWDAAGNHAWTRIFDGTAHGNDAIRGLGVDPFGRFVAGGTLVGTGTGQDFAVWALDALGSVAWSATWNGPFGGDDFSRGLTVDAFGNVTLAGSSPGAGGASDLDLTFAAWDPRGVLEWTHRDDGSGTGNQRALWLSSSSGLHAAAGYADGAGGTPSDYRTVVVARTAVPFCFGDGSAAACPCANASAPIEQAGCASSFGTGGRLMAQGTSSIAADTLVLRGASMPNSSALYFQGTSQQSGGAGVAFGDGLRCAGGVVIRLGTKSNASGASQYPMAGDPSISSRGLVTGPGSRTYQVWYRNSAAFCTSSTFNLSNGLLVTWSA